MIVCSCNLLTDRDIRDALASADPPKYVREVYAALGCAPVCGGCATTIAKLMNAKQGPARAANHARQPELLTVA